MFLTIITAALTRAAATAALLAQQNQDNSSGGAICVLLAICFIVGGIIASMKNQPVRCKRCGFRAKKNEFRGGRCPNCDSYEF
jgi:predicted Zn-ribbon and HTH transcriptional regulator